MCWISKKWDNDRNVTMFWVVFPPSPDLHSVWHELNPTNVVWKVSGLCFLIILHVESHSCHHVSWFWIWIKTYLNSLNISKHVFSLARLVFSCLPGDHLERLFNEAGWFLLVTTDLGGWTLVPDGGLGYPKMVGPCCFIVALVWWMILWFLCYPGIN